MSYPSSGGSFVHQRSRERPATLIEVGVTRDQRQAVLDGNSGDPDVVLWERTAETTQCSLYLTIHARGCQITGNAIRCRGEGVQVRQIFGCPSRSPGTEIQLSQHNNRDENSFGWQSFKPLNDVRIACPAVDKDIGVEEE